MLAEPWLSEGPWRLLEPPKCSLAAWGGLAEAGVQEDPGVLLPSQAGIAAGVALESTAGAPAEL